MMKSSSSALENLTSLFMRTFGLVALSTMAIHLLRAESRAESWDKAIYGIGLLVALIFFMRIFFLKKIAVSFGWISWMGSLAGIIVGLGGIELHDQGPRLSDQLWLGFGPYVLVLVVFLGPFIWKIYRWNPLNRWIKLLIAVSIGLNVFFSIPSLWQDVASMIDPGHSEYVLNEALSFGAGHWPLVDFIPQYQVLFTFLLAPFSTFLSAAQLTQLAMVLMSLSSFMAVGLGVILVRMGLHHRSWITSIGLVVPLTCLTQFPIREGYFGSIASLLSGLPARIFPGMVLFSVAIGLLTRENLSHRSKMIGFTLLGMISGLVVLNSQDFGIAAVVVLFGVLFIVPKIHLMKTLPILGYWVTGLVMGLGVYPLVAMSNDKIIRLKYLAHFVRQFGSGFGAESIKIPGPVLLILPLIIALIVSHLLILKWSQERSSLSQQSLYVNGLVGLLFSGWAILGFSYYLNRSYASGQMQILFLPIAISFGALIGTMMKLDTDHPGALAKMNLREFFSLKSLGFLPVTLVASVPLASILLTPNPVIEMKRIREGFTAPRWHPPISIEDAYAAHRYSIANQVSVGYFGASAHYIQKETGLLSVSIFNSPNDMMMSPGATDTTCSHITQVNPDFLLLSDESTVISVTKPDPLVFKDNDSMSFPFKDQMICGTYSVIDVPGIRPGHFMKRIP